MEELDKYDKLDLEYNNLTKIDDKLIIAFSIGCGVFFTFLLLILLYMIIAHPDFTLHPFGGDGGPAPTDSRQPMFMPSARPTEFKAPEMLQQVPQGIQGPAATAYANQACKKKQTDSVGDSS